MGFGEVTEIAPPLSDNNSTVTTGVYRFHLFWFVYRCSPSPIGLLQTSQDFFNDISVQRNRDSIAAFPNKNLQYVGMWVVDDYIIQYFWHFFLQCIKLSFIFPDMLIFSKLLFVIFFRGIERGAVSDAGKSEIACEALLNVFYGITG